MRIAKLLSLVLAVTLALSLAACTSSPTSNSGTPASQTTNNTNAPTADANIGSDLPEVTLKFFFFDMKKSATDEVWNAISEKYKDQLNAKFDVEFIPGSDYKDKIRTKISAGDKWDLNFDGEWLSYFQVINNNGYMALDELMPQYAPDLYAAYEKSGVLKAASSKGHVVGMPWSNEMNNRPFFLWRGDLIDTDPSSVKTIEDVDKLVHELKEKYPDKYINGDVTQEPFQAKYDLFDIGNNFVVSGKDSSLTVQQKAETDAYRERAQIAEKWQRDGIIWADVQIDKLDHNALINQGQLLTKFGTHEFAFSTRAWVEPDARWGYNSMYDDHLFANRSALSNLVAIPYTSENPERTLMFLNLLETDREMYNLVHYGIEGVTYNIGKDDNGVDTAFFPDGMDASNSNYMLWQGRWGLWKPQFMLGDYEFPGTFWQDEKEYADSNPNNVVSPLDGFNFDPEAVTVEIAQMNEIYESAEEMIKTGLAGDANAAMDKLVEDLNRAGLEKVKAEMQKQVNEFVGK